MLTDGDRRRILVEARNMALSRARLAGRVRRGDITPKSYAAALVRADARFMDFLKEIGR